MSIFSLAIQSPPPQMFTHNAPDHSLCFCK